MSVSAILSASSDHRWVLTHYEPGESSRAHRHDMAQTSLLLAGGYIEESPEGILEVEGLHLSRKESGFEHQNQFSDAGALILSVQGPDSAAGAAGYHVATCGSREAGHAILTRTAAGAALPGAVGERLGEDARRGRPAWISQARERLIAEPHAPIATLARTIGRHPVAFARAFRGVYGRGPAQYRHDWRVASALHQIVRSQAPLAEVAIVEGFSDQAHMTRAIRQACGWSPGALRRLFAA